MSTETSGSTLPFATNAERDAEANKVVERYSLGAGVGGLLPLPLLDVVTVGAVQLYMLRRLSAIYGVPFSENRGKAVLSSLIGAIVPATTASGVASFFKFIPGVGQIAGTLTMAPVSAGATYIIGKVFIQHFASGGTLLDFNPPDYREFIKAQREKLGMRSGAAPAPESASAKDKASKGTATTSP
jgi:uncharacterized protein (DUF697 family)